ncbi:alpha/beta hydrolase [Halorubrum vacuolatum]|uniref:Alpha/beta hydrolase n=1 Tax=Halorubrum vacuolatum TaxID=63740 RepID=A0A238VAD8_HALVU|nr:alpha/beta hydrolase [Halorubrum vacuolatum]SNR30633.1 hypothetical protein SAMN06264855_10286 [Halorubrum vacuolatum]
MSETVLIPGARDVRASLDRAVHGTEGWFEAEKSTDAADRTSNAADRASNAADRTSNAADRKATGSIVVACPPDPRQRGHRGDGRLRAVSDVLTARGVDCLRFDYGAHDDGYGESTDADRAVGWALERYDRVALFGYSFGGCIALVAGTSRPECVGTCALAPTARLNPDVDAVAALDSPTTPVQVIYGTRDETAEWRPVVDRAREVGADVVAVEGDHFFVGQTGTVAEMAADWLVPRCLGEPR